MSWFVIASALLVAADPAPLAVNAPGRAVAEPSGAIRFGWPAAYFEGRFRGTAVRVRLDAPGDRLRLLIDGEEKARFSAAPAVDVTIGGLAHGDHVVRLEKLAETQEGASRFVGFYPAHGSLALAPPARDRQIELIGDSHSVGYGNTSPARQCTAAEIHARTDAQQSFGPLAARRFDADYRVVAYSGFGVVRNYDGGRPGLSLPAIYGRPLPAEPDAFAGRADRWQPEFIVINLGTNDFSTPLRAGERWRSADALRADYRQAYAAFVRSLAARQPQAKFILMGSDDFIADVGQVAAAVNRSLPGRATTLRVSAMELTGCDWHPSLADHREMADLLAAEIVRRNPAWGSPPS